MNVLDSLRQRFARRQAEQASSFFELASQLADPSGPQPKPDAVEQVLERAGKTVADLEHVVALLREHRETTTLARELEPRRAALREVMAQLTTLAEDRAAAHAQFTQRDAELTRAQGLAEYAWRDAEKARDRLPALEREIAIARDGEHAVRERELAQQSREQLRREIGRLEVELARDRAELASHEAELKSAGTGMHERHSVDIVDRRRVLTSRVERNAQDLAMAQAALAKFEDEPAPEPAPGPRGRKRRQPTEDEVEAELEAAARGSR